MVMSAQLIFFIGKLDKPCFSSHILLVASLKQGLNRPGRYELWMVVERSPFANTVSSTLFHAVYQQYVRTSSCLLEMTEPCLRYSYGSAS